MLLALYEAGGRVPPRSCRAKEDRAGLTTADLTGRVTLVNTLALPLGELMVLRRALRGFIREHGDRSSTNHRRRTGKK
jgi:hypothetical protein